MKANEDPPHEPWRAARNRLSEAARSSIETFRSLIHSGPLNAGIGWFFVLCACGYASAVLILSVCGGYPPLITVPLWFCFCSAGIALLYRKAAGLRLTAPEETPHPAPWKLACGIALFCWLMLWGFGLIRSFDTGMQWQQVMETRFDDWHPVIHTFCLWLTAQVWQDDLFAAMVQCALFATLCGWLYSVLLKYHYRRGIVWGILLFTVLSPASVTHMRVLWKDSAFALACMGLAVILIHLRHTRGEWLLKPLHCAGFLVLIVLGSFLRHNGFFLTAPLLVLLPLLFRGKKNVSAAVCVALAGFLCMGGYAGFRAQLIRHHVIGGNANQRFVESIGLPMSMLSEVFVYSPEQTPPRVRELFGKIAPREQWVLNYRGDVNSVKSVFPKYSTVLSRETTPKEFFSLFLQTVRAAPRKALKSFLNVTGLVWNPVPAKAYFDPCLPEGLCGWDFGFLLRVLLMPPLCWLTGAPGMYVLLWVLLGVFGLLRLGWKALPFFVPFLAYGFGTMLLLSGWDYRFFFAFALCIAPTALMLCTNPD